MEAPSIPQLHRVGYARVSSVGQNLDSQVDALQKAGCKKIFTDKMTGSRMDRPGWDQLMDYVRSGDALVVTELSRMTRSLIHLLETAQLLEQKQVNLVSLRENIDTSTATGRCFLSMMGAIHQMERELRAERASAGRASAKARGKTGGRPRTDVVKLRETPKCSMTIPARRRTKSARSSGSAGGSSLHTSLNSEISNQRPSLPIRPFRGVGH
jgi:DNA invertase Pin-like site-specific DNA recombinase